MNKNYFIFIILLFLSNNTNGQAVRNVTTENFKKLNWLIGTWYQANTKPGYSAHERWEEISPYEHHGFGITLQGKDTVFIEKLRILIKENDIYYVADVPENQKLAYFKLIEITDSGFVCENPNHDFPKKISYQLDGEKLKAQISGDGKAIDYLFERKWF
ncbi:MAG: DUF6265 family protein [Bacteroidota bacterium]